MTNESASRVAILIDLKKDRIRIYKKTLHSIGDPEYILLLVNPEERTLAILRSDRFDLRSHRIPLSRLKDRQCIELYSKTLVKDLFDMCAVWQENNLYRMYGDIIKKEGIAQFYINESELVFGRQEW